MIVIFSQDLSVAFRADAVREVNDTRSGQASSYPREAGGVASDHFSADFPSVRFVIGVTNSPLAGQYNADRVNNMRDALHAMHATGELWTVTFEGRTWSDMLIQEVSDTITPTTGQAMYPSLLMKKIKVVNMVTERIPAIGEAFTARAAADLLDESAEEEVNNGEQGGDPNASLGARLNLDVGIENFAGFFGGG